MNPLPTLADRAAGALLGLALGDTLGMPVDGLSHQNVRTYYRGIKEPRADEKRGDLGVGQGTAHTARARLLARALASEAPAAALVRAAEGFVPRRGTHPDTAPTAAGAACAAPLGIAWRHHGWTGAEALAHTETLAGGLFAHPAALAGAYAMAAALRACCAVDAPEGAALLGVAAAAAARAEAALNAPAAVSRRLAALAPHLDDFPLDLQDRCDGTGIRADEAFPFAVAMVARGPDLPEATLLSAVNVGGAAAAVGAIAGALLGARHGPGAFAPAWLAVLEDGAAVEAEARALAR